MPSANPSGRSRRPTPSAQVLRSGRLTEVVWQDLVTLNRFDDIDPAKVISRMSYAHPHFTAGALAAQRRQRELNGANRTWFCGAYWGKGFHEDGVRSALAVCSDFGAELDG